MREAFLRTAGSTPEAFERVWPRLLQEHQIQETLAQPGDLVELTKRQLQARGSFANFDAVPSRYGEMVEVIEG